MTGQKRSAKLKVYDNNTVLVAEDDESTENPVLATDEIGEDELIEQLLQEGDPDAALVIDYEETASPWFLASQQADGVIFLLNMVERQRSFVSAVFWKRERQFCETKTVTPRSYHVVNVQKLWPQRPLESRMSAPV